MTLRIRPRSLQGNIKAIASKSAAHRLLICAALADAPSTLLCEEINEDICATVRCLTALGAHIERDGALYTVNPIQTPPVHATLDCGESGSTLRFLLPVVAALGCQASFVMHGRLPERPLSPLREELERHGITLSPTGSNPLQCSGKLCAGTYRIRGDVSSQFISGLLFALSLGEQESELIVEGRIESVPYIHMTQDALSLFGAPPLSTDRGFLVGGKKLCARQGLSVEGDWSNAAFALCAGAMGKETVSVSNLRPDTHQGDRAILTVLRQLGATVRENGDTVSVSGGGLHPIRLDASQIPDLVPVIAVTAAAAVGTTEIYGAARLRIKESDRLLAVCHLLQNLGVDAAQTEDGLIIHGTGKLKGGEVDSFRDHRIAMSAAVASVRCESDVLLHGAEAVAKSYPAFWQDFATLGLAAEQTEEV